MIEYVEIRSADNRELVGIIDTAKSVIWHSMYYGVGDFEIYAPCTAETAAYLLAGNYVTRADSDEVGIIEKIDVTYNPQDGRMIIASGRFAKSILDRRVIYTLSGNSVSPSRFKGNVETAVRGLVADNAISCAFDSGRNISELVLGAAAGLSKVIVDENGNASSKQVTYNNLLEYTDSLLQEYEYSALCQLDNNLKLSYVIFEGKDRSVDNTAGNEPVIFSQDFDNLLSSEYVYDSSPLKNTALIGGAGEGTDRFCTVIKNSNITGISRRELFVDASSSSRTYTDADGATQTFSNADYESTLKTQGRQSVSSAIVIENLSAEIDLTNSPMKYGKNADYYLGDIVTAHDVEISMYINPRIIEVTEVQDENGYTIAAVFGQ